MKNYPIKQLEMADPTKNNISAKHYKKPVISIIQVYRHFKGSKF